MFREGNMNIKLKILTVLIVFLIGNPFLFGAEVQEYTGEFQSDVVILKINHKTDKKSGKTQFSIKELKNKNRGLLKAEVIVDGKSFVFVNAFEANGGRLDPDKVFTVDGFPDSVKFIVHFSMYTMSRSFDETHNLELSKSSKSGKGLIVIDKQS